MQSAKTVVKIKHFFGINLGGVMMLSITIGFQIRKGKEGLFTHFTEL